MRSLLSGEGMCPHFGGDLVFGPASTYEVGIAGYEPCLEFDTISIDGTVTFDGTLQVVLRDEFVPQAGDLFAIATYGARLGEFDEIVAEPLAGGLTFEAIYGATELTLLVNGPPQVEIAGPPVARRDEVLTFQWSAVDPSPFDQAAGFTYAVDWTSDGVVDETFSGGDIVVRQHAFPAAGSYTVSVSATDVGGATGTTLHTVHVYRLEVTAGGDLEWEGSGGADRVEFVELDPQTVEVRLTQLGGHSLDVTESHTVAGRVRGWGGDGRDRLDASALVTLPADLSGGRDHDTLLGGAGDDRIRGDFDGATGDGAEGNDSIVGGAGNDTLWGDGADGGEGGADTIMGGEGHDLLRGDGGDGAEGRGDRLLGQGGDDTLLGHTGNDWLAGGDGDDLLSGGRDGAEGDDTLSGGSGNDVLSGGSGADQLNAGSGRNILLGGAGTDTLSGGTGQDLLVADRTSHDQSLPALMALRNEWTSNADYLTRIARLNGSEPGGANGSVVLIPNTSVLDDAAIDQLLGGDELDWFILRVGEDLPGDLEPDEVQTDSSV